MASGSETRNRMLHSRREPVSLGVRMAQDGHSAQDRDTNETALDCWLSLVTHTVVLVVSLTTCPILTRNCSGCCAAGTELRSLDIQC